MKKLHNYGTFNNDLYEVKIMDEKDISKIIEIRYVGANELLILRKRWDEFINKKQEVLTDEQKQQLQWQKQVARMKKQSEDAIKWMKEFNSWSLEKRYEYWQKAYDDRKKANIKVSKEFKKDLQEMKKRVELEKNIRKIKTHVFAIEKWNQMTTEQINSEVQSTIKEAEYKLDCEKKNIEYHPIQHV